MPLTEHLHLKTQKWYRPKRNGLFRSHVNKRPIHFEMRTVSSKLGISLKSVIPHNSVAILFGQKSVFS